ncbi:MAG TPA: bifunctional diguanylate cyclase/phosphodiesterase, partial [Helicobacteraceae bacterium]|nr:bifunctional diguanylate cyclase/phosphodiesterase [Helicobacteraceae bacterium]
FYSAIFIIVMLVSAFIQLVIYYTHRKKSFIDPLTGMFNRQYMNELLKKYAVHEFQVLIMDLDHFKQVNDIYGHDAGDEVLRSIAARIQSVIRKKDILIRYGGEEFILLIAEKDKSISLGLAERIRNKVKADPVALEDCQLNVTISMGLNPRPEESKTFEHAVKIADLGLYKAKQLGRDRVEIYDDTLIAEENSQQKMCDVKEALDVERIFCVYQPIYDAQTLQISRYELLIRMRDAQGDIIEPAQFLPSIRYTQVYVHLTKRVLSFAFEALKNNDVKLSINFDLQDLFNDEIFETLEETFSSDYNIAKRLSIEILEHEEITEFEYIEKRLVTLKSMGFNIAIDDFGSGYANYRYILNMNIDALKIDGSLIKGIHKYENAKKIVQSIHQLAQSLGVKTVAEHVETQQDLEALQSIGIDYIQGFYLAKPDINFK